MQVEPLRAQAETAKQYLIYRDELRLLEISVWLENLETLKTNAIKLDTDLSLAREELKKANADLEALYAASEQFSARIHENDIAQEEKRAQLSELDAQVKEQESAVAVLQTGIAHNEENIARVEEDTLSSYPLSITKQSMDISGMLSEDGTGQALAGEKDDDPEQIPEFMMLTDMFASVGSNDLSGLKSCSSPTPTTSTPT